MKGASVLPIIFFLVGCGQQSDSTTISKLSEDQVSSLQAKGARGDIAALRQLDSHYLFTGDSRERSKIHGRLLELGDSGALYEEAMRLAVEADHAASLESKISLLQAAQRNAQRARQNEPPNAPTHQRTIDFIDASLKKVKQGSGSDDFHRR